MSLLSGRPGKLGGPVHSIGVVVAAAMSGHALANVDVRPFADLCLGAVAVYVSAPYLRAAVREFRGTNDPMRKGKAKRKASDYRDPTTPQE